MQYQCSTNAGLVQCLLVAMQYQYSARQYNTDTTVVLKEYQFNTHAIPANLSSSITTIPPYYRCSTNVVAV